MLPILSSGSTRLIRSALATLAAVIDAIVYGSPDNPVNHSSDVPNNVAIFIAVSKEGLLRPDSNSLTPALVFKKRSSASSDIDKQWDSRKVFKFLAKILKFSMILNKTTLAHIDNV